MDDIQSLLLDYIDDMEDKQEKMQDIILLFKTQRIQDDKHLLTSIIHFLATIISYHYQTINFYDKICNLILFLKDSIMKYYSNYEIYNFFSKDKRIILFLLDEKMIFIDYLITSKIQDQHQEKYFYPEIKQFLSKQVLKSIKVPENFEELRNSEYNYTKQLIQKDLLDEFIIHINKTNLNIKEINERSIYETSDFISNFKFMSFIQYSAFFGSIRIFKYLLLQGCDLQSNLWYYAIHGRNPEIINILEENNIQPNDESYVECLKCSIKCHHNEIANYFLNNYLQNEKNISKLVFKESLKFYNFSFIQPEMINSNCFYYLCKRDYFILAKSILDNDKDVDINSRISIEKNIFGDSMKIEKTVLFDAIKRENYEIIQLLLENYNIDANKKSLIPELNIEITPLYEATRIGNIKIVQCLLDHKDIDVNLKSFIRREKLTPLYVAIKRNDIEIVRILIQRNDIDINLKSLQFEEDIDECILEYYREITPLYFAIQCSRFEIVQLLIENKNIDVNDRTIIKIDAYHTCSGERYEPAYDEETALYYAVNKGITEIVKLLLSHENINININEKFTDINGNITESSVLEVAISRKNIEIIKLVEQKNAIISIDHLKPDLVIRNKETRISKKLIMVVIILFIFYLIMITAYIWSYF